MNIIAKHWSDKNLDEIFDKNILTTLLSKYKYQFELYRKLVSTDMEIQPPRIGKILPFDKSKNHFFDLHNILGNTAMKLVIASIFTFIIMSMLNISFSNAEKPTAHYLNIRVSSGDTLWTIASQYASNKEDLRELVYTIKTLNGLDNNALIYAGQTLKVPAQ